MNVEDKGEDAGSPPSSESPNTELLKFLREENEKNRASLREEAEATRKFFVDATKLVSYPLTALVLIAGFLGWNNISNFITDLKKQSQEQVERTVPGEVKSEVQREVPGEVGREVPEEVKRVLPPAINQEVSKRIAETQHQTELAVRDKVRESLDTAEVQKTITDEINKSETLKKAISRQIDQAASQVLQATKASAPRPPTLKVDADNDFNINPDHSLTMTTTLRNIGQKEASNVVSYSSIKLLESSDDVETRKGIFTNLAREIAESRRSKQGTRQTESLPWNNVFSVSAAPIPLSSDDESKLQNASKSIYFMFYVEYEGPNKGRFTTYFCGSTNGDLKIVKGCVYTNSKVNYNQIIKSDN
jgi:hypothetical protein